MGDMLRGECPCGFKSQDLVIGCGMMDQKTCRVPAACPVCHVLGVEDLRAKKRTCRRCRSVLYYLHEVGNFAPADVLTRFKVRFPWALDETGEEDIGEFPNVRYRCPKCGKQEMALVHIGCWD